MWNLYTSSEETRLFHVLFTDEQACWCSAASGGQQRHSFLGSIVCLFLIDLVRILSSGWVEYTSSGSFSSFLRIDRQVGIAHGPQMCCFSPVWSVSSLYRVSIDGYT